MMCLPLFTPQAKDTNEWIERTKRDYAFSNWVGKTRLAYTRIVTNWVPDFSATGFTNIIMDAGPSKHKTFLLGRETPDTVIVRVVECSGAAAAHEALIEFLSNCTVPYPLPEGKYAGLDIGDKCYVGYGTNTSTVMFTRNNVFIWVYTSQTNINIPKLARKLDDQVTTQSRRE